MGLPHVTSFCWCMGLEMGAKTIGYGHLLVSLSMMVVCSMFAEGARGLAGTPPDAEERLYATWYGIAVAVAVVSVVHVLLALTLIYSVHKRWASGARAWAWVMAALWAAALLLDAASLALTGVAQTSNIFLSFLEGLLFFGMLAYCIICVNSYYLMLRSVEDMEGPNKSIY